MMPGNARAEFDSLYHNSPFDSFCLVAKIAALARCRAQLNTLHVSLAHATSQDHSRLPRGDVKGPTDLQLLAGKIYPCGAPRTQVAEQVGVAGPDQILWGAGNRSGENISGGD